MAYEKQFVSATLLASLLFMAGQRAFGQESGGLIQTGKSPYPLAAKAAGIEGTVVLMGTIGPDGKLHDVAVVKGPEVLRQAAFDTVMGWVYRPFAKDGVPVSVNTKVKVFFSMGSKKQKAAAEEAAKAELAKEAATAQGAQSGPVSNHDEGAARLQ